MEIDKAYIGTTEDEIWQQIATDINDDTLEYRAMIEQDDKHVMLDIDIDLGGGFEGGYATTSYSAPVANHNFKFAVHEEHFTDEIGKFFGMQDVEIGYPELDHHLVIKTNDEEKVKTLFVDPKVREVFTSLTDFDFGIHLHDIEDSDEKQAFLELNIEDGITDIPTLKELYHVFYTVLLTI
ncbi:hypothetical protein [Mucilaginibacter paludis]|uniref:Uncharacterized protein n=1 Tax=Mucilaginibacter paludis DSM 18603 TaxID=714943 RepID=H1Y3Q1_9SPHI|nr:hypothetical protein [Mucilaginibacter paludis]EHQ30313.1 hypothetical protein Mucpa_6257 [Mucilaginibacter paludis DSM 18603]